MTTDSPTDPKSGRRWFQFSLRMLLVFVLIVSLPLGWFTHKLRQVGQQRVAAKAIQTLGGYVGYEHEFDGPDTDLSLLFPGTWMGPPPEPPGPSWLRKRLGDDFFARAVLVCVNSDAELERVRGLPHLKRIAVGANGTDFPVTDEGLRHLGDVTGLKMLWLICPHVTDNGVQHLKNLRQLETLLMVCTPMTDAGLGQLRDLRQLQILKLFGARITDAGLEHIRGFTRLEILSLSGIQLTDVGIERLDGLAGLKSLDLSDTKVADAGLRCIGESMPQLKDLSLRGTEVSDAGLTYLRGLRSLEELDLDQTQVTDAGLKALAELANLQRLHLDGTGVTDAGLECIEKSMRPLNEVWLRNTKVTAEAVRNLRGSQPLLSIRD